MKHDQEFLKRWTNYVKKNQYAEFLEFGEVIIEIHALLDKV
jgi:hypothetical protein